MTSMNRIFNKTLSEMSNGFSSEKSVASGFNMIDCAIATGIHKKVISGTSSPSL